LKRQSKETFLSRAGRPDHQVCRRRLDDEPTTHRDGQARRICRSLEQRIGYKYLQNFVPCIGILGSRQAEFLFTVVQTGCVQEAQRSFQSGHPIEPTDRIRARPKDEGGANLWEYGNTDCSLRFPLSRFLIYAGGRKSGRVNIHDAVQMHSENGISRTVHTRKLLAIDDLSSTLRLMGRKKSADFPETVDQVSLMRLPRAGSTRLKGMFRLPRGYTKALRGADQDRLRPLIREFSSAQ